MRITAAALRLLAALAGVSAVVATFADTASRVPINPFNFFGFFTMQSNIIFMVTMFAVGALGMLGRTGPGWLTLVRGCATTYIVIVGIVYNTLLVGLEGGVSLEWANTVLHVVLPVYAALDWVVFSDRAALPWKRLWVALLYPVTWVIVVLIRGASDGWVPYPFLDPSLGYPVVVAYCVGIAVATIVVAAVVWALSRVRLTPQR